MSLTDDLMQAKPHHVILWFCEVWFFFMAALFVGVLVIAEMTPGHGDPWVNPQLQPHTGTTTCEEDMPCWDCETMGNHVCGLRLDP